MKSLGISAVVLLIIATRNVLVLGGDFAASLYFPSYTAVSLVNIGKFLQRIEVMVAVVFIFGGFVKISVCIYAATKGVARILQIDDYRPLVAPIGLLMMNLSCIIYDNIMEMQEWAFDIYMFYAFPFQVVLPLLILLVAEIKVRVNNWY